MTTDKHVRRAIYALIEETGEAPTPEAIAAAARTDVDFVKACLLILADQRLLVLGDDDTTIRLAPPFSGAPTQHVVESMGVTYHAHCAWDALGILAALDRDGVVRSSCAQSGEALELAVGWDGPAPCDWVFHSELPAARWWDDIVHTRSTMLFFRSEGHARQWSEARGSSPQPVLTIPRLWALAVACYGDRLDADYERPEPDELAALFAGLGLTGPFWELGAGEDEG